MWPKNYLLIVPDPCFLFSSPFFSLRMTLQSPLPSLLKKYNVLLWQNKASCTLWAHMPNSFVQGNNTWIPKPGAEKCQDRRSQEDLITFQPHTLANAPNGLANEVNSNFCFYPPTDSPRQANRLAYRCWALFFKARGDPTKTIYLDSSCLSTQPAIPAHASHVKTSGEDLDMEIEIDWTVLGLWRAFSAGVLKKGLISWSLDLGIHFFYKSLFK